MATQILIYICLVGSNCFLVQGARYVDSGLVSVEAAAFYEGQQGGILL